LAPLSILLYFLLYLTLFWGMSDAQYIVPFSSPTPPPRAAI
jgi:hypothetical protein